VFPFDYPIHKVAHHFDGVFISNGPGDPTHCQSTVYHLARLMETGPIPVMGICLGHQLLAIAAGAKTVKMKCTCYSRLSISSSNRLSDGNRAHNIPTLDLTTGRCHITSQNHGYAVDAATLPPDWKEYFINLNDSSNEGMLSHTSSLPPTSTCSNTNKTQSPFSLRQLILITGMLHATRPIFSTQFHPEAKGGPQDRYGRSQNNLTASCPISAELSSSAYLFDSYVDAVRLYRTHSPTTAGLGLGQAGAATGAGAATIPDRRPNPLLVDLLAKERFGVKPNHGGRPPRSAQVEEGNAVAVAAAA
jgi:carbamoyl-phosphate synthase small subunit